LSWMMSTGLATPAATASLPMNGSPMAAVCQRPPT
jgi:hypothetical protein